ncbi:hypothetical protein K458DRAFT_417529 [Lentithecium fluviatile CBS 122367]|uniref:Uncharacterized protein n=1 Tax=Lentithecium fluviatile CBS 122367 TaxID=1168545 RepID=A0A6G1J2M7_9PLEO|nr:hypothetical protein K458DRAFT_417529 [Lentithecium fluviatile CBS 122367]
MLDDGGGRLLLLAAAGDCVRLSGCRGVDSGVDIDGEWCGGYNMRDGMCAAQEYSRRRTLRIRKRCVVCDAE